MTFHAMKLFFLSSLFILSFTMNTFGVDDEKSTATDGCVLVCTPGAKDAPLKEMLRALDQPVISLNLESASNLENPLSLFQDPLPNLKYLKVKYSVDNIVKVLPEITPNLIVLDVSQTNLLDVTLLSRLGQIPSLRVLDISGIPFQPQISDVIWQLLSDNPALTIYLQLFKKLSPRQETADLSIYKGNPRIVLGKTYASSKELPFAQNPTKRIY